MMSIRRRLVSAVCLISLGSSVVIGDEKNPFAEWDKIQKSTNEATAKASPSGPTPLSEARVAAMPGESKSSVHRNSPLTTTSLRSLSSGSDKATQPSRSAARSGSVEYFSPGAANSVGSALPKAADIRHATSRADRPADAGPVVPQPEVVPQPKAVASGPATKNSNESLASAVLRERLKVATASPNIEPAKPVDSPEKSQQPAVWPADFTVGNLASAKQPMPSAPENFAAPATAAAGEVRQADFSVSGPEAETIRQVSGADTATRKRDEATKSPFDEVIETIGADSAATAPTGAESNAFPASQLPTAPSISSAARSEDVGPQSPGVTLQWVRHGEFNVGQPADVELVVENTSRSIVRSVLVEAEIPAGLQVTEVTPKPLTGSATPSWTFGELKPGEKRSVAMKVIPRQRGELAMNAFVRLTGFSSSTFAVQEPMIGITVTGPDNVEVGQQVSYVVKVTNPGTGVAGNVIIQSVVPEGLEHRKGSLLTIEIGPLNPGESRQAQLNLTAVKGGAHQMAIRVVADGGLTDQTVAVVSIAEPRLHLQITGPAAQLSGRTETYVLNVTNEGSVPSANVRAKYRVPQGFEFVAADHGGKFSAVDRSIEWFVGTVQPAGSRQFEVSLRASETGNQLHQAGVISEHGKVTMAEHSTSVDGIAALELKVKSNTLQPKIGDEITYEIQIANTGTRSATNVGLSCELPSAISLKQASGPTEYIAENGVMVFKSLPQIEAGKSVTIAVRAICNREGTHRLRLRVASESIGDPLIGEETSIVAPR